jgi:predicted metalloprotease with PDZ domain
LAENAWQTSLESVRQPILKSQSIGQRLATFTVGIRANRYHSRVAIAAVLEGSSAKHAGLHLGDEIVMLNGIRTSDMTDQAIAETLEREDGMAMLTLRRGEMEWNATLLVEGLAQVLNRADVTDGPQIDNTKMARAE